MAYDAIRRRVVLIGGEVCSAPECSGTNEIWEYFSDAAALFQTFGTGCGPNPLMLPAPGQARPWIGELLRLDLAALPASGAPFDLLGASARQWGSVSLPLDLGFSAPPAAACTSRRLRSCRWSARACTLRGRCRSRRRSPWSAASFYTQGAVVGGTANPAGVILSNAGIGIVGTR